MERKCDNECICHRLAQLILGFGSLTLLYIGIHVIMEFIVISFCGNCLEINFK